MDMMHLICLDTKMEDGRHSLYTHVLGVIKRNGAQLLLVAEGEDLQDRASRHDDVIIHIHTYLHTYIHTYTNNTYSAS